MLTNILLDSRLSPNNLGEGACFDETSNRLWWVDTNEHRIHGYDLVSATHSSIDVGKAISFVFPERNGGLLAGLADGLYRVDPNSGRQTLVAALDLPRDHRLNDGKLDPVGRLWVGTINSAPDPTATAALYRLGRDGFEEVEGGYTNANGKVWSPDGRTMYHADTSRGTIWQYDYDAETGNIANKRAFATTPDRHPDGLAIDSQGVVFAAMYGGSHIAAFDRRGNEILRIDLSVANPTSCAFGRPDRRRLFVTSARDGMSEADIAKAPLSGSVFVIDLDGPGLPVPSMLAARFLPLENTALKG